MLPSTFQEFAVCLEDSGIPASNKDSSLSLLNPIFSNLTSSKSPSIAVEQKCSGRVHHRHGISSREFIETIAFLGIRVGGSEWAVSINHSPGDRN